MKKGRMFLNVARLLNEREVKHHESWLTRHGFTRAEARTLLLQSNKFIDLWQRLCEIMVCMPEDTMDWEGDADSPLSALKKQNRKRLEQLFVGKSQKDVDALLDDLERKVKGL